MSETSHAKRPLEIPLETPRIPEGSGIELPQSDIAARAFELYCQRGCEVGHDLDDWLSAESELIARRRGGGEAHGAAASTDR